MLEPTIGNNTDAAETATLKDNESAHEHFSTTTAHRIFFLVSTSFTLFGLPFLLLYSDRTWFAVDIIPFSIPAALLAMLGAHFISQWLESPAGCSSCSFIWKGLPPVAYLRWVQVNQPGFPGGLRFGNRLAIWSSIDIVELTFFGNLLLKTRSTAGPSVIAKSRGKDRELNPAQLIFKIPFGVASRADQSRLVDILRKENPQAKLNNRLIKQVSKEEPKGSALILNIVSVFFVLFFMDVAFSTFSYLEMLKQYVLAKESAEVRPGSVAAEMPETHWQRAEHLRLYPLPISWVTRKMFQTPSTKAGVMQIRADALWAMNRREEALSSMREALEEHSKNFRAELKLARMLVDCGRVDESYKVLDKAADKSKKALVPRMYVLSLLQAQAKGDDKAAAAFYAQTMKNFDQELFKDNAGWPPEVSLYFPDVWHREDVEFIVQRMLRLESAQKH